ncbi:MAG: DUF6338 family protein [Sulfuricaulis sp.]
MDLANAKELILFVVLVVPGYLYNRTKARFVIMDGPASWQEALVWYVVHSLIITGIAFALLIISGADITGLLTKQNTAQVAQALIRWQWIAVVFVLPLVLGFASGMTVRFDLVGRLLNGLSHRIGGIRHLAALPELEAWDSCFLQLNRARDEVLAVQVILKTGEVVCGEFGPGAVANRKGGYTDLFLSRALSLQDDGSLKPVANSCGLFIRGSEVRSIFLFRTDGEKVNASASAKSEKDVPHDQVESGPTLQQ